MWRNCDTAPQRLRQLPAGSELVLHGEASGEERRRQGRGRGPEGRLAAREQPRRFAPLVGAEPAGPRPRKLPPLERPRRTGPFVYDLFVFGPKRAPSTKSDLIAAAEAQYNRVKGNAPIRGTDPRVRAPTPERGAR